MLRGLLLWMLIMGIFSGLIFGYKYISKKDIAIAGKLISAAIFSFIVAFFIFINEMS